jgi:hypothetical protein
MEVMIITREVNMTHKEVILMEVKMAYRVDRVLTLKASQGGVRRKITRDEISNATNVIKHTSLIPLSIHIPN